jgi:post-segregation antitoxin (ccd killing protein)
MNEKGRSIANPPSSPSAKIEDAKMLTARLFQQENAEAVKQTNLWVERNGLPLANYRLF